VTVSYIDLNTQKDKAAAMLVLLVVVSIR